VTTGKTAFCRAGERIPATSDGKLAELDGEIVVAFGRYRNRPLRDLAVQDPACLKWMPESDFAPDTKARSEVLRHFTMSGRP